MMELMKNKYRRCGNHVKVFLGKDRSIVTIVDNKDLQKVSQFNWYPSWSRSIKAFYVIASAIIERKRKTVYLHRLIANAKKGKVVDHINRNTLDNRSNNLRVVTQVENTINNGGVAHKNSKTGILGVSPHKGWEGRLYYCARVNNGKTFKVEYFPRTPDGLIAAGRAVKSIRRELHGI